MRRAFAELLHVRLHLFDNQLAFFVFVAQKDIQTTLFLAQFIQFFFEFETFQTRQLTQADFQNVFRLNFGQSDAAIRSLSGRLIRG